MTPKYGQMCQTDLRVLSNYVKVMKWKSGEADSVQVWSFGTKIILLTSACAFIGDNTSDIT